MPFDPTLAAIRFGTGCAPHIPAPQSVGEMLATLAGPDRAARDLPIPGFTETSALWRDSMQAGRAAKEAEGTARAANLQRRAETASAAVGRLSGDNAVRVLARHATTADGLRERLTAFWADHFTVISRGGDQRQMVTPYVEEAIRPHITGRFVDLLRAAALHPMMLLYLQQSQSFGPNSDLGQRRGKGLNENLGRELLELHTLGVNGGYTQADVTQLAELLTGLTFSVTTGFTFEPRMAEPGAETILGKTYPAAAQIETVDAALADIAAHPSTARHIAWKLAVHFVADTPPEALITRLADTFTATGGDLMAVTEALLTADEAWTPQREKVRLPFEFIAASLRALAVPSDTILALADDRRSGNRVLFGPLRSMGQVWETPLGPDGWPEAAADWIIPQGLAARINWAMTVPRTLVDPLPDPRNFVTAALGTLAPPEVAFAAGAAESVGDGIGVVLASAAFQRR